MKKLLLSILLVFFGLNLYSVNEQSKTPAFSESFKDMAYLVNKSVNDILTNPFNAFAVPCLPILYPHVKTESTIVEIQQIKQNLEITHFLAFNKYRDLSLQVANVPINPAYFSVLKEIYQMPRINSPIKNTLQKVRNYAISQPVNFNTEQNSTKKGSLQQVYNIVRAFEVPVMAYLCPETFIVMVIGKIAEGGVKAFDPKTRNQA